MNLTQNGTMQAIGGVMSVSALIQIFPYIPEQHRAWIVMALIAAPMIQGIAGIVSHLYNPNGTPATQPYDKDKK